MSTIVREICRQQQFLGVTVARTSLASHNVSRNRIGNHECKLCFKTTIQGIHKMEEIIIYFNLKVKLTKIMIFLGTPESYHKHPEGTCTQC
jgi:formate dehydrogenase assembly factor FdhD